MKTKIITISAKAEHGKDLTATILKEMLEAQGRKVLICHYADLLKYICKTFFNWDGVKDTMGRSKLQYVGTDIIRKKKPSFWVDFIESVLELFENEWDYVLIPDCRFGNEIDLWKQKGWNIISLHIERVDYQNSLSSEQRLHISETALDDYKFDYYIKTFSSVECLSNQIEDFINEMLRGELLNVHI